MSGRGSPPPYGEGGGAGAVGQSQLRHCSFSASLLRDSSPMTTYPHWSNYAGHKVFTTIPCSLLPTQTLRVAWQDERSPEEGGGRDVVAECSWTVEGKQAKGKRIEPVRDGESTRARCSSEWTVGDLGECPRGVVKLALKQVTHAQGRTKIDTEELVVFHWQVGQLPDPSAPKAECAVAPASSGGGARGAMGPPQTPTRGQATNSHSPSVPTINTQLPPSTALVHTPHAGQSHAAAAYLAQSPMRQHARARANTASSAGGPSPGQFSFSPQNGGGSSIYSHDSPASSAMLSSPMQMAPGGQGWLYTPSAGSPTVMAQQYVQQQVAQRSAHMAGVERKLSELGREAARLRDEWRRERENAKYYEASVGKLYERLTHRRLIGYLDDRLHEDLSPTMRVSVAVAKAQAVDAMAAESERGRVEAVAEVVKLLEAKCEGIC